MDDYIFLIIAVVISIFAAIKKNKDKKQILESGEEEPPRNFLLDQLLGEDFLAGSDEEFQKPVRVQPVKRKEVKMVVPEIQRQGLTRKGFKTGLPERKLSGLQMSVTPTDSISDYEIGSENEGKEAFFDDFSLKKAVVYSEILNPKY